ncbi:MAG: PQQ-dependent sugar dehydrogenase [Acidimicrobiia bacterium]|nr:PQQ-dependent sugar dehydrogenase [Acidimicrobiia bacterium]
MKRLTAAPVAVAIAVAVAVAVTALLTLGSTATAQAAATHPRVRLVHIADLDTPTAMATRAGDTTLYVAEQAGRVVAVQGGTVAGEPVLDVKPRIAASGEQGLLGLTFSPDGDKLIVHFTNRAGNTRVEAYDVTNTPGEPAAVDLASRRVLLKVHQPEGNHNGGQLAFTPDGDLFLGLGDGGGEGDEGDGHASGGNGQSTDTLLGKIVRVDLAGGGGEICDRGLRNPWRFSFDRETGDLWIGDVGQGEWEEIDRLPADATCDHNLGWNILEGDTRFRSGEVLGGVPPIAPVAVFPHERSFCAVIGGYVYRGTAIPALDGWYVFSDYCDGTLRALRIDGDGNVVQRKLGATSTQVASFGEGTDGELYVLSQDRGLFRIAAA